MYKKGLDSQERTKCLGALAGTIDIHSPLHTTQVRKSECAYVLIKDLHHSTLISENKEKSVALGHQVRGFQSVISRHSTFPLPMFYVDLDPNNHLIPKSGNVKYFLVISKSRLNLEIPCLYIKQF